MLALLAMGCSEKHAAPGSPDVSGQYVRRGAPTSTLDLHAEGDRYVAVLAGRGFEGRGASTAADCSVRAVGSMRGDVLIARFAPFTTDVFSYGAAQAEIEHRSISIRFTAGNAEVLSADTEGYCGSGATFLGSYQRVPTHRPPSVSPAGLDAVNSARAQFIHTVGPLRRHISHERPAHGARRSPTS